MARAGRHKRKRSRAVPAPTSATGRRPAAPGARRRRLLTLARLVAAVLALGFAAWLVKRGSQSPTEPSAAVADPTTSANTAALLPAPDTSGMTPPVARAIREARQAALDRPASAAAVGQLGQVLHAHWLHDAAADCYEIAWRLAPGDFRWVYLLAGVEDIQGADGDRIDRLFREAIRLAPDFPPAYVRYADALMRLSRWPEARDAYAVAAELDPELILAHRGLGQAAILLEDGAAAVEHLELAARLAPEDRIAQAALARAYALANRGEEAAEAARKTETLTAQASLPDPIFFAVQHLAVDPESLRKRAARGLQKGDYEAAVKALTLLEESAGPGVIEQQAAVHKRWANELAFGGDFAAALPEFERAARLAPTDPEIEHNWGTVLLRRGDLEPAGRHFEKAIELNPQSADSLYNLGVVLEGLGRTDEALERFAAATAIEPRHVAAGRLAELGLAADR